MKNIVKYSLLVIVLVLGGINMTKLTNKASIAIENAESWVGQSVVVKNDTLIIVDYSIWNDYTLEDGTRVSPGFVSKMIVVGN